MISGELAALFLNFFENLVASFPEELVEALIRQSLTD